MAGDSVAGRRRWAWIALGVAVLVVLSFVYGFASTFNAEYGDAGLGVWTWVVVGLVVGAVAGVAARTIARVSPVQRPTAVALVVAVVAAAGVVVAALVGGVAGAAQHASREAVIAESCAGGADATTVEFAESVGRVVPTNGASTNPRPDGCAVMVAIDKSEGDDPLAIIDEVVADTGWQRRGEATWVRDDGFEIEVRLEPSAPGEDLAEHAVELIGKDA